MARFVRETSLSAFLAALLVALAASARSQVPTDLVKLGGISAEHGEFAFRNNLVTAYSDRDIFAEIGSNNKRDLLTSEGGSVSFELKNDTMRAVTGTARAAVAHEFQFCDPSDQVSIPVADSIKAILPKDAKVKSSEELLDGRTLVAFSVPGNGFYKIFLSLLKGASGNRHVLVGNFEVSEYGFYCGEQVLTTDARAILVDEPAGSSDYSAVYFFAIKGLTSETKE